MCKRKLDLRVPSDRPAKVVVCGHAGHGKDTFCRFMPFYFSSASAYLMHEVFLVLGPKYHYKTPQECWNDRGNHRQEWFDIISSYNKDDPGRLIKEVLEKCPVYCGLRSLREYEGAKDVIDVMIWVDASRRVGGTDPTNEITPDLCDIVIDNNYSLDHLAEQAAEVAYILRGGRNDI